MAGPVALLALNAAATAAGQWFQTSGGVALWFPAAGVTFVTLLLCGWWWLPAVVASRVLADLAFVPSHGPVGFMVATSGATGAAYAAAAVVARRLALDTSLRRMRDAMWLCATGLGGAAGAGLAATATRGLWARPVPGGFWHTATTFGLGDGAGVTAVAPVLLLVAGGWWVLRDGVAERRTPAVWLETVAQAATLLLAARFAVRTGNASPLYYPLLLPLGWIALRRGVRGAAVALLCGSAAVAVLVNGGRLGPSEVNTLELFLGGFAISGLLLGVRETERGTAKAALAASAAHFRSVVDSTSEAYIAIDQRGRITGWNTAAHDLSGFTAEQALGASLKELVIPRRCWTDHELGTQRYWRSASRRPIRRRLEVLLQRADGVEVPVELALWSDVPGDEVHSFVRDISDRRAAEAELTAMATHDSLTGLPNRTLIFDRLSQAIARTGRDGASVAVLFVDLDRFKVINDDWGHETGDEVLRLITSRLRGVLRPADTVGRLGGDEFIVICDGVHGEAEVLSITARIEAAVAEPLTVAHGTVTVTASIGVAIAGPGEAPDDLLRQADDAMYMAKEQGRARHTLYHSARQRHDHTRIQLREELRTAIGKGELLLLYQPVVDLRDRTVSGVEALIRWVHPTRGTLSPGDFLAVAEADGLIVAVGDWVLHQACEDIAVWQRQIPSWTGTLAVNVSGHQLAHPAFTSRLRSHLRESGLAADRLCLESTETVLLRADDSTRAAAHEVKDLGVCLSIDDFGTGYASLSYLRQFPFDILKIDRSFTAGLGQHPQDEALVSAVLDIAHALGLGAVTEGVETVPQLEKLIELGGRYAQGYLLGRPMPIQQARQLASEGWHPGHPLDAVTARPIAT